MSHIWMSHVTHTKWLSRAMHWNESFDASMWLNTYILNIYTHILYIGYDVVCLLHRMRCGVSCRANITARIIEERSLHMMPSHCNTLQHTATHCNTLQHTATHYKQNVSCHRRKVSTYHAISLQHAATHCNTPQHTATYCNTLQYTATHCNTLQHTATDCKHNGSYHRRKVSTYHAVSLQHTATHCNTLQHTAAHCSTLQHTTAHCNTVQHSATHCRCICASTHDISHVWLDTFIGMT